MSIINKIEVALQQINDAIFQELCNQYLVRLYNLHSLTPTGSVIGKEKTRKGTPDTFFVDDQGGYVFVEYTTQQQSVGSRSFFSKIQEDISKCLDPQKTQIPVEQIHKIIVCHTGKLSASEDREFTQLCTAQNSCCHFEQYGLSELAYGLIQYPELIQEYLGIHTSSGQLMKVSEFLTYYEKPELKLATSLRNQFLGRQAELMQGLQMLQNDPIVIIHGASGTGKSRFALELCDKFILSNPTYTLFCVADKGVTIYEDLQNQLHKDQDYLFFIDDANRMLPNVKFILYLLQENRKGKIKLVITVRDYAISLVSDLVKEFHNQQLQLEPLSDDVISDILKSDSFNIQNSFFIDKIKRIARGNARIAVMCASVANREQSLSALNDVSQLYEIYFKEAFDTIKKIDHVNALKVLGLISFFRTISKDQTDLNQKIYTYFDINEETFWKTCDKLYQHEFVDLYDKQIVKISDQILATYLFYQAFFVSEVLDFKLLVTCFIDLDVNFYDAINPLLIAYEYKKIKSRLSTVITSFWPQLIAERSADEVMKVIRIFYFCCEIPALLYIKKYIENLPQPTEAPYGSAYNLQNYRRDTDILALLAKFRYLEPAVVRASLELKILYIHKAPHKAEYLANLINEKYSFKRTSYLLNNALQHTLFDCLIEHIKNNQDDLICRQLFLAIVGHFLETHCRETEFFGNQFKIYHFTLCPLESIKLFRDKLWKQLWGLYPTYKKSIYTVLLSLPFPETDNEKDIWRSDAPFVLSVILEHLDYRDFQACEAAYHYLKILDRRHIIQYDQSLKRRATNRFFKLYQFFLRAERADWSKMQEIKQRKLRRYCRHFDLNQYIHLFNDLTAVREFKNSNTLFGYDVSLIIADLVHRDTDLFFKVLEHAIVHYSFNYQPYVISGSYFKAHPDIYQPFFDCLTRVGENRSDWLFAFHECLPENLINEDNFVLLSNNFFSLLGKATSLSDLVFVLDKYSHYRPQKELYIQTIVLLNEHYNDNSSLIPYIEPQFFYKAFEYCEGIFDQYCRVYYLCKKLPSHYDSSNEVLKQILSYKPDEIARFFRTVYGSAKSHYDFDCENWSFIWELENYEEILIDGIDYFMQSEYLWHKADLISILFTNLGKHREKAYAFVHKMINRHYDNKEYTDVIFLVIANCLEEYKCEYIKQYLTLNPDFAIFKDIQLFPLHQVYAGRSKIPCIQQEIEELEKLVVAVKELTPAFNYLEHIDYLETKKKCCQQALEEETRREFLTGYNI